MASARDVCSFRLTISPTRGIVNLSRCRRDFADGNEYEWPPRLWSYFMHEDELPVVASVQSDVSGKQGVSFCAAKCATCMPLPNLSRKPFEVENLNG